MQKQKTRNFAIIAHVDHGKTTLGDTLVAMGGIISEEVAASKRYLDQDKEEQKRGITILSTGITVQCEGYTYNLIDSPGHVDFSSEVEKSLRAIDGVLVLMDIVEGIMPQGENVLRQALKQGIRPVLFVNKADRLFNELNCTLEEIKQKLLALINGVNELLDECVDSTTNAGYIKPFSFSNGNIIVGSALYKFAINPAISSVTIRDLMEIYSKNRSSELPKLAPIQSVLAGTLNLILPSPIEAQKHKFKDYDDVQYADIKSCNQKGAVVATVISIKYEEQSKVIQIRILSGTLRKGSALYCDGGEDAVRVSRVCKMFGKVLKEVPNGAAGQIVNISGNFDNIQLGSTLAEDKTFPPFQIVRYTSEPVVSVSFKPKNQTNLVKLKQVIKQSTIQDATLKYSYIEETQEHIISGIGKLQLEVVLNRIQNERGIPLVLEKPTVIYRETITEASEDKEVVTSNKLNKFKMAVQPLPEPVVALLKTCTNILKVPQYKQKLVAAGMSYDDAKKILYQEETNLFINSAKSIQFMQQTAPNLILGFKKFVAQGPLLGKPVVGVAAKLTDATFHCDFVHRTPADMAPPTYRLLCDRMLVSKPKLLEPYLKATVTVLIQKLGNLTREITKRRGRIQDVSYTLKNVTVICFIPIKESNDLAETFMSVAEGRLSWSYVLAQYEYMPDHIVQGLKATYDKTKVQ